MRKIDLLDIDFFNEDRILQSKDILEKTFLIRCCDIKDLNSRENVKEGILNDIIIEYGISFGDKYEFDKIKFIKKTITEKKNIIEALSLKLLQNYDYIVSKDFNDINQSIIKKYISNYTSHMLCVYNYIHCKNDDLKKINLRELENIAVKRKLKEDKNKEMLLDGSTQVEFEDRIKNKIKNNYSEIKRNRESNKVKYKDVFLQNINNITKVHSNVFIYIIENYANYKFYREKFDLRRNLDFIKNMSESNLELFDMIFLDKVCNNSLVFEIIKFIEENKIDESEYENVYRIFLSFKYLPVFDDIFISTIIMEYLKLEDQSQKRQFEIKVKKLVYYISYVLIPLYNMVFPNVVKGIHEVCENYFHKLDKDEIYKLYKDEFYELDKDKVYEIFKGKVYELDKDRFVESISNVYQEQLKENFLSRYNMDILRAEKIINKSKIKLDRLRKDKKDQKKSRDFGRGIVKKFEESNKRLCAETNFDEVYRNDNLINWFGIFDENIGNIINDKEKYQKMFRKFIFNIIESQIY